MSGNLGSLGNYSNVGLSFEYGLSTSYGKTIAAVPPNLTAAGAFNANLTGLAGNTLYHYRAKATASGGTVYGADSSFITCSTAQQSLALIQANSSISIIDVRTPEEFITGYIEGAINIDYYASDFQTRLQALNKTKTYLVYCGSGKRSSSARDIMASMGFSTIYTVVDGLITWKSLGYPLKGSLGINTASPLPNGQLGVAYNQTLTASGGKTPYTWSITSGTLPVGLALNASSGAISGTPTTVGGPVNLTFQVTDNAGAKATKVLALTIEKATTINIAPVITTQPSNQTVPAGEEVTFTADASGSPTPTVQWQSYDKKSAVWINIDGATSKSYTYRTYR